MRIGSPNDSVFSEITDHDMDDLFAGDLEEADAPAPAPTLLQRIGAVFRGKPEIVRATILIERADQLVLSFVLPKQLDWSPGTILELRIGGQTIQVRVDPSATTAAAKLGAGVTVRLTLTLDAALPSGAFELDVCGLRLTAKR
jgi:hypothetical protein